MKANRAQVEKALRTPSPDLRFILLYGPDEAGSRALARLLAAGAGAGAERVDLNGVELRGDPAKLADEAASMSLFGSARYIVVEPAGDECIAAVQALVDAASAGNPVALVAGALKPASKLLKLALAAPCALAFASYVPEGREAVQMIQELGRELGLNLSHEVARRVAQSTGGNRAIIVQELSKFALFLDAEPERAQPLDEDTLVAIGAASEEGDLSRLVDSVGGGDVKALEAELLRLAGQGVDGIMLLRAVLRRMMLLARLRSGVESGNSVSAVMASEGKSVFWKEKDAVAAQVVRWRSDLLAKGLGRLLEAERQVKAPGALGPAAVNEELFAICRQAARLR